MPRKRSYLRTSQFQAHPDDAKAIDLLSDVRLCGFGLNPRGRVYGVSGGLADSHAQALLQLPHLIEVSVSNLANDPIFTDVGFEELIAQSAVQIFGCAQNPALTDRAASAVPSSQLRWLGLNCCNITDAGVKHICGQRQLLGLYLAHTQITHQCVSDLCRLADLRNLNLQGTKVSEAVRDRLSAQLPKCRSMRLGGESPTTPGPIDDCND